MTNIVKMKAAATDDDNTIRNNKVTTETTASEDKDKATTDDDGLANTPIGDEQVGTELASEDAADTIDEDLEIDTTEDMPIHPKDGFRHNRDMPQSGSCKTECGELSAFMDYPTLFSCFTHGPLLFMSPGLVATAIEVLDPWEAECGLKAPEYPTLAYDIIPRKGDVESWEEDGPKHFLEKLPL